MYRSLHRVDSRGRDTSFYFLIEITRINLPFQPYHSFFFDTPLLHTEDFLTSVPHSPASIFATKYQAYLSFLRPLVRSSWTVPHGLYEKMILLLKFK